MSKAKSIQLKKFHANPIELIIFSVLATIFANSVYSLFYEHPGFTPVALTPMKANPTSEGRHLASVQASLITLELDCAKPIEQITSASKARINGPLCGMPVNSEGVRLTTANITNTANKFQATVFAQNDSIRFSTDFIPLVPGKNPIHVEFSYTDGGKSFSQDSILTTATSSPSSSSP